MRLVAWTYWQRPLKGTGVQRLDRRQIRKGQAGHTHGEESTSTPSIAPSGRRWKRQAWMMLTKVAMRALDYDAKLTSSPILTELTRETQMMLDNAMCDILGCELEESQQRSVQQPGCVGELGARRLSRSDRADAACWATCDLHAQVIRQPATELGRAVTSVADGCSWRSRRGSGWRKAGICARPNAILKLTENVAQARTLEPGERCHGNPRPHQQVR